MEIRLRGLPDEVSETVKRLHGIFAVVSVSKPCPDRGTSRLIRVFVEIRL